MRGVLRWYRRRRYRFAPASSSAAAPAPASTTNTADGDTLHGHLERGPGPRGFDLIGAFLEVLCGNGPSVAPQQRTDVEHADAASIEVRLEVHRELLNTIAEIEQAEMSWADVAAAGADKQLASALQHVDPDVVDKGTGDPS